jgi:predicted RNA-binding Zn ribbon-like protein
MEQLFIDFANSEWYDGRGNLEDRLLLPTWREAFLADWGLRRYGPIDQAGLRELILLRSAIRSIAERLYEGGRPAKRDVDRLNSVLASHPLRFSLSGGATRTRLDLVPLTTRGARVIAGEIALSAARYLAESELGRIKMCDNPGCRWLFIDETKNRRRRWCGPCGNVDRVRRFRERQRLGTKS